MWKWQTHSVGRPGHVTDKDTRTCLWIYPQPQSSARWGPILYASLSPLVPSPLPDSFPFLPLLLPPLLCSFPIPTFISLLLPKVSFNFLSLPYCLVHSLTLPLSYLFYPSLPTSPFLAYSLFYLLSFTPSYSPLLLRSFLYCLLRPTPLPSLLYPLLPPPCPYSILLSTTPLSSPLLPPSLLFPLPCSLILTLTPSSSSLLHYPLPYSLIPFLTPSSSLLLPPPPSYSQNSLVINPCRAGR